jgi:hypothetical protein
MAVFRFQAFSPQPYPEGAYRQPSGGRHSNDKDFWQEMVSSISLLETLTVLQFELEEPFGPH